MKFPSFIKTTKYSQFSYEPRYYDPIKEEIDTKMKAARARQAGIDAGDSSMEYKSSISAAFGKREKKSNQTSIVQLLLAAAIFGVVVGWLFVGNDVFYIFLVLSPLYFYFRLKKKKSPTH
ncbi:hypothetical protein N6H18_00180 [Reichenbachiella agarivorans]|uniref:Uncharacterized protein n=1 Tax=Reichenbachiella agarivorans TaxID=2979464 RepID=A0ABY6CPF1_9BACT|nr:hypothetical protein [Reichenbachiella agarivorans]UXP32391.1 hypothetical protein N6H18_00180 [Reichenbachiella agarivorans]